MTTLPNRPRSLASILTFSAAALLVAAGSLAAAPIDRTFPVGAGGTLEVDAEGASVTVRGGAQEVRVAIERGSDSANEIEDDYTIDFEQSGERVTVTVRKRSRSWISWRHGVSITVDVPTSFDLELETSGGSVEVGDLEGEVNARTSGGSVRIGDVRGSVKARTSGGSIRVDGAVGDIIASTSGGSITIGDVEGTVEVSTSGGSIDIERARGNVSARTSGGSIDLADIGGAVDARTSGGSVRAYISRQPSTDSRLSTSGGRVEVILAEGIAVDLDAEGTSGVRSEIQVAASSKGDRHLVGTINGGGPELYLRSSGGSVRLREQ